MGLVDRLLAGDLPALARLATHVENDSEVGREALSTLYPRTGRAHVVGVTGAPGAGKSTLVSVLIKEVRESDRTVGVVAIDPTSSLSGGAALGDRIRMLDSWADTGVFIRSMASRGRHGGLAPATASMTHLFDAAGFDLVVVETVGVGQEEIDVANHVHTVVLLQVPGLGDGIQAIKAGVLEVADIYVVNKADRPGSNDIARELRALAGPLARQHQTGWTPPILKTSATTGDGIADVVNAIDDHRRHLAGTGAWQKREERIAKAEVEALLRRQIIRTLAQQNAGGSADTRLIEQVARREVSPATAAHRILERSANRTEGDYRR
ncbi:MAG: methylmalonyl Co-A mutase-associated GTPase MeaB [Thermomicrobiales bacterium]